MVAYPSCLSLPWLYLLVVISACDRFQPLFLKRLVCCSQHFRGHFTEIASHIVEVTGPGIHSSRLSDFIFENIRRPLYPIDGYFDGIVQEEEMVLAAATSRL